MAENSPTARAVLSPQRFHAHVFSGASTLSRVRRTRVQSARLYCSALLSGDARNHGCVCRFVYDGSMIRTAVSNTPLMRTRLRAPLSALFQTRPIIAPCFIFVQPRSPAQRSTPRPVFRHSAIIQIRSLRCYTRPSIAAHCTLLHPPRSPASSRVQPGRRRAALTTRRTCRNCMLRPRRCAGRCTACAAQISTIPLP